MARIKGPKKTNRYPDEFKIKAVQLADNHDIMAKDVAEDLGVHPILLYRWRKEYREGKFKEDKRKKNLQVRFDLLLSFTQVIARLHVEMKDKALHPFAVASFSSNRIVSPPHHITHVIKDLA